MKSLLDQLRPAFPLDHWFAKTPAGFAKPSQDMHLTFDSAWRAIHHPGIGKALFDDIDGLPHESRMLLVWQLSNVQWWILNNGVTVFPEAHLVNACAQTDVLDCVTGADILPSFPSLLFALPVTHGIGHRSSKATISHILVNFVDAKNDPSCLFATGKITIEMPKDASTYVLITAFWNDGYSTSYAFPLVADDTIAEIIARVSKEVIKDEIRLALLPESEHQREMVETEEIGLAVASLVMNLTLMMQSYPAYVTKYGAAQDRRHVMRNQPRPSTYSVNDHRVTPLMPPVVHEQAEDDTAGEGSSEKRKSPKPHWRRAHWKRQEHGLEWETAHPAHKVIILKDGRRAHMVRIPFVFVS